jgi:hypothetical protein
MLDVRETATILAALLYWREEMCPHGREVMRPYLETLGLPHVEPLSAEQIERLSERLQAHLRALGSPEADA